MGITGLLPFIEKASRRVNVGDFDGCTVAIDSYCWLHKGAFACADRLVRGEETDVHIKYCLKYVNMLLSKNIKPVLVFDGRHLPAKALTESKRRESRNSSKKRAAELLKMGRVEEARSFMRRSVDITHEMALSLIKECRNRNVDCIVAPYEADAQLAYLNIKNIAQLVITEDSDLILFGCTKVLFKMDLEGFGTLVETEKLPLVMKCPIEHYTFDKFRQMCIMSGCDYLASLPGIGLAKARQFVVATHDSNFANALKKLAGFFNRANLTVTDEYRENFLKAEATFKHQYVYDPIDRKMVRLTEPDSDEIEQALCVNAGELMDPDVAFELALGNLDPFTLKKMDDWHPDRRPMNTSFKTDKWMDQGKSNHPSVWSEGFKKHLSDECPWQKKVVKKVDPIFGAKSKARKVVNLVAKYVPETQDESLSIETLSNMYCLEPSNKRPKVNSTIDNESEPISTSPILENKHRSFKKMLRNGSFSVLKRLSKFPRTIIGDDIVESKFFSTSNHVNNQNNEQNEDSPTKDKGDLDSGIDTQTEIESQIENSQKENSPLNSPVKRGLFRKNSVSENKLHQESVCEENSVSDKNCLENAHKSPILSPSSRNPFRKVEEKTAEQSSGDCLSQECVVENEALVSPNNSQEPPRSAPKPSFFKRSPSQYLSQQTKLSLNGGKKCRVPGLKRTNSLPSNQPTLLSKFGFEKKPVLKR